MTEHGFRERIVVLLATIGVAAALMSGLSHHLDWVANLCGIVGQGCHETSKFVAVVVPVWLLGLAFYVAVISVALFCPSLLFWVAVTGMGMELAFVWIMLSQQVVCVFCLVNLFVILAVFSLTFDRQRIWQTVAMVAVFVLVGLIVVRKEDVPSLKPVEAIAPSVAERAEENLAAKVGERVVSLEELEAPLSLRLHELKVQAYRLKRDLLEQMVARLVFEKEAGSRGMPVERLIDETVLSQVPETTQEELERYFLENPSVRNNWKGTAEDLDKHARNAVKQRKFYQLLMDQARSMYAQQGVKIYIKEPEEPRVRVSLGDAMVRGAADAPVVMVEFSDYQCPACRKNHETIKAILETYKDKVKYVFKDFPLRGHRWAAKAAEGARCAGEQGKFFEFQDVLFSSDQEPNPDQMEVYALEIGLDSNEFKQCVDSGKYRRAVEQSVEDGRAIGVGSTPTLVINGRITTGGQSEESLSKLIDQELSKKEGAKP
jgi:protein-disulfide isomerase